MTDLLPTIDNPARILIGDALETLRRLPDSCVHCVATSPPYWALRDYGVDGQIGLESTPEAFVARLVEVFEEVRRVLHPSGVCWVNIGDSYSGGGGYSPESPSNVNGSRQSRNRGSKAGIRIAAGLKPKDLCGVPWRLAFALQAPKERRVIKSESDRSWMAGLVDGEGCLTILRTTSSKGTGESYPPIVQLRMCDPECVAKSAEITGFGCVSPIQNAPSHGGNRGSYHWRVNGRKAADVIADLYPFLLVKRRQAVVIWNHQKIRESYSLRPAQPIPQEALEKQKYCRELIQKMNKREAVDLPSWMEEPAVHVEPGWYLRSDCIWHKPAPMPESVTDRPTKSHEYVFLLAKEARYFYDAEAVKEMGVEPAGILKQMGAIGRAESMGRKSSGNEGEGNGWVQNGTRNRRSVWTIASEPYPEAHFATFPPALVEPMIKAGSSEKGVCPACGEPWRRVVERRTNGQRKVCPKDAEAFDKRFRGRNGLTTSGLHSQYLDVSIVTGGWQPSCKCPAADPVPALVLDPFAGSGTTLAVAVKLKRRALGIELNPAYAALAEKRLAEPLGTGGLFDTGEPVVRTLFDTE